jgi:hypothetical protein
MTNGKKESSIFEPGLPIYEVALKGLSDPITHLRHNKELYIDQQRWRDRHKMWESLQEIKNLTASKQS